MIQRIKEFFHLNGKLNKRQLTSKKKEEIEKEKILCLSYIIVMLVITLISQTLPVNAEETNEDLGELMYTEVYTYTTYTRITEWYVNIDNGVVPEFVVFYKNVIQDEQNAILYYPCVLYKDKATGKSTKIQTMIYNDGTKSVTNEVIEGVWGNSVLSESGNRYYIYCPIISPSDYAVAQSTYKSILHSYAPLICVNDYSFSWENYINIYEKYEPSVNLTYTYNSALDFAQISANHNVKYTIQKDNTGAWNFITPSEAGVQFNWTNRSDVQNAYVNMDIYGTFYDSMWASSGTYTHINIDGINKADCSFLLQQSVLTEMARSKNNATKGHGFDINYIYVQSFGTINGVKSKSRIYKFNSDLISDYGNADSQFDEYLPEITQGIGLPTDYELDETLTDPELTEPSADITDDTNIMTPVDNIDYTGYYDEKAFLKAFTSFFETLKSVAGMIGQIPTLFATIFSFLPEPISAVVGGGLLCCIVLRFIGR